MRRAGLLIALLVLLPRLATAQPADVLIFPGAELDQEVTAIVHQIDAEKDGAVHTWVYATDAAMDGVIAFYVAHGYHRHDAPDWASFTQETFGVRIRRVVMLHPSTPEHQVDARDTVLLFLERPYPRIKDVHDVPSPENVVDRTGITVVDLR